MQLTSYGEEDKFKKRGTKERQNNTNSRYPNVISQTNER